MSTIFLNKNIEAEFERCWASFNREDPFISPKTVGLCEVLTAHYLVVDYFGGGANGIGGIGPRDNNLVQSALARQFTGYGGRQKWISDFDICATLLYGLISNHPFYDANKRTALLSALLFLRKVKRVPTVRQKVLEKLVVDTADHRLGEYKEFGQVSRYSTDDLEVRTISEFLRRNTEKVTNHKIFITYKQLAQLLGTHGFEMKNPHGNYIDITKREFVQKLFRTEPREVRVGNIGFPGWTKQVSRGVLKEALSVTGLSPENGYDANVLFNGAEPLSALIDEYAEPLKRLASK